MAKTKPSTKATKPFSIRPATHDDLRPIVGLYNWAVNQTFATIDSEPLDTEEAAAWWEAHGKRSKLIVCTDENGLIGWARLFPWNQRGFDVVEDLVYVDPVHHGQGIGHALLTELIKEAQGLADEHIDKLSRLYEGKPFGFRPAETRVIVKVTPERIHVQ